MDVRCCRHHFLLTLIFPFFLLAVTRFIYSLNHFICQIFFLPTKSRQDGLNHLICASQVSVSVCVDVPWTFWIQSSLSILVHSLSKLVHLFDSLHSSYLCARTSDKLFYLAWVSVQCLDIIRTQRSLMVSLCMHFGFHDEKD